ncbi:MAG TPA: hypothetical protein VGC30_13535, partial [Dokdonella sp.]
LDPAGLGLSTMANTYANKGVKMLSVEGVGATTATVGDGSYPLYITLYLAERVDSPKQPAIDRFLAFLETPAAKDILRRHELTPYADAGAVMAKNEQRMAFIDAHVGRDAAAVAAATLASAAPAPTPAPVAAPRATLEAKNRIAPTAESTQAARENLARAEAKKAEAAQRTAAAKKAEPATVVAKAEPSKKAEPKAVAKADAAKSAAAKKKAEPAKALAKADAPKKKANTKTAKADAPHQSAAPAASFGNVSGGASGSGG